MLNHALHPIIVQKATLVHAYTDCPALVAGHKAAKQLHGLQKEQAQHCFKQEDYSNPCSQLHREYSDEATLNGCSFNNGCDFSDLQKPVLPNFQSVSAIEELADALDEEEVDQY